MAGEDVSQAITFNIIINARGLEEAKAAKTAMGELDEEQKKVTETQGEQIRSGLKLVNHFNRLQNVIFRAAVLTGIFKDQNTQLAQSLKAVAIGLDVGLAAARAFLIVSQAVTAAAKKEGAGHLIKWIAASGPVGAPLTAAIILGTIGAALTTFAVLSAKSAAFGGIFDRPTNVLAGDSPRGPELIAPVRDILNRGGTGNIQLFIDGKEIEDVFVRRTEINRLRGLA